MKFVPYKIASYRQQIVFPYFDYFISDLSPITQIKIADNYSRKLLVIHAQ